MDFSIVFILDLLCGKNGLLIMPVGFENLGEVEPREKLLGSIWIHFLHIFCEI
jgi:hypothetical protein